MTNVRKKAEALRDKCEEMINPQLSQQERTAASDRAKAYWQMSRVHADTVAQAADVQPEKFTAKNTGTQAKTRARIAFVSRIASEAGLSKRQEIALAAWDHPDRHLHFDDFNQLYNFLGRHKV